MQIEALDTAATYAVACELVLRNIKPRIQQIGKSGLQYETAEKVTIYLHVAGKQVRQWQHIELPDKPEGTHFLILVDFEGKAPSHASGRGPAAHPDFYVLSRKDWDTLTTRLPYWRTVVDGHPYFTLAPLHVSRYHERWDNVPR